MCVLNKFTCGFQGMRPIEWPGQVMWKQNRKKLELVKKIITFLFI